MPIYTRSGDDGYSVLSSGLRIPKDSPCLEVCGTLDELIAWLGLAAAEGLSPQTSDLLRQLQRRLFETIAEIAEISKSSHTPQNSPMEHRIGLADDVNFLEKTIDRLEAGLPACHGFILPGGCRAAAIIHIARTVCRRAERRLVSCPKCNQSPFTAFLNRLGDLLFVLARSVNAEHNIPEILVKENCEKARKSDW